MKKLLLVIPLAFMPLISFCQKLSLDDLISIYKMDQMQTEEYLDNKGWDEEPIVIEGYSEYGIHPFSYGKHLVSFGDSEGQRIRVMYQSSKSIIETIQEKAITLGMANKKSGIDHEGTRFSIYVGARYALRFITRLDGSNMVTLVSKDYLKYYKDYRF
jgi:hypothetical protein